MKGPWSHERLGHLATCRGRESVVGQGALFQPFLTEFRIKGHRWGREGDPAGGINLLESLQVISSLVRNVGRTSDV